MRYVAAFSIMMWLIFAGRILSCRRKAMLLTITLTPLYRNIYFNTRSYFDGRRKCLHAYNKPLLVIIKYSIIYGVIFTIALLTQAAELFIDDW